MDPTIVSSMVAVGGLGILFGAGLALASKKFAVEVDPRIEKVAEALPNANCGACGYPGCAAFAEAVVGGKVSVNGCTVGGPSVAAEIAKILGVDVDLTAEKMVAVVQCQGGKAQAKEKFVYRGIEDCAAAELVDSGHKACTYGCLGLGTCVRACPFDAMYMDDNGLPVVIEERCTGCGICVQVCPRGIMALIPVSQKMYLACVSQDKGKAVRDVCSVGCVTCGVCANPKFVPSGGIVMEGNLPKIVNYRVDDLPIAWKRCPTSSFVWRGKIPEGYQDVDRPVKVGAVVPGESLGTAELSKEAKETHG